MLGPEGAQYGVIFAFQIAPTIIFIAALFAILYYFGIMQLVVRLFAVVMNRVMGASGAESLNVAASIFMGQTEAPLTIRPYLPKMTESELMTVMTSGMAHISGGIMAAYIAFGIEPKHLLTAVIMTAPGTLMMAKMFVPETAVPETLGTVRLDVKKTDVNVIDAAGRGTGEGLHLAMNVIAMLISFMALIALTNALLGWIGGLVGVPDLSLQKIFGLVFAPMAWSLGVAWKDAGVVGNLLGTRMVLNEFIAFAQLGPLKERWIRGRSPSRRSRSAALRTSPRSGFRSAASARWCRSAVTTSGASRASARCSPGTLAELSSSALHRGAASALNGRARILIKSNEAAAFLRERLGAIPDVAIVLGSGLGAFGESLTDATVLPYESIPHWPASNVVGHAGKLVAGTHAAVAC